MYKLLTLALMLFLFSCSDDDDDNGTQVDPDPEEETGLVLGDFDNEMIVNVTDENDDWKFLNIKALADLTNKSDDALKVNLIVDFKESAGHKFSICDDKLCYTGITDDWSSYEASGEYINWPAGAIDDDFIADPEGQGFNFKLDPYLSSPFLPSNSDKGPEELIQTGVTVLGITLENVDNPEDSINFEVRFEIKVNGEMSYSVREINTDLAMN